MVELARLSLQRLRPFVRMGARVCIGVGPVARLDLYPVAARGLKQVTGGPAFTSAPGLRVTGRHDPRLSRWSIVRRLFEANRFWCRTRPQGGKCPTGGGTARHVSGRANPQVVVATLARTQAR